MGPRRRATKATNRARPPPGRHPTRSEYIPSEDLVGCYTPVPSL